MRSDKWRTYRCRVGSTRNDYSVCAKAVSEFYCVVSFSIVDLIDPIDLILAGAVVGTYSNEVAEELEVSGPNFIGCYSSIELPLFIVWFYFTAFKNSGGKLVSYLPPF